MAAGESSLQSNENLWAAWCRPQPNRAKEVASFATPSSTPATKIINTGDQDQQYACTAVLRCSSVSLRRCLRHFRIRWISIRSYSGEAMGAVAGHSGEAMGEMAWSSPRKGEEVNDELVHCAPPELALLLVKTEAHAGVFHIGKRQRRLHGGWRCLLWTHHARACGHECHSDGEGEGAALFPRGLDTAPFAAAAIQSGPRVLSWPGRASPLLVRRGPHRLRCGPTCWELERMQAPSVAIADSPESGHRSGEAVRVNRQRQLKQVLRFGIGGCGFIFLSPVKPTSYLRLKTTYPRRHRPIKQSKGAPAMLSEYESEDHRYFYRGHFSWAL
ncbi:unnamed protein product [Miscanthus lutarioriparius]|uniref:Uncharacterized protein n=1 Tax=Miscanthus lutarioriparius TaxID=422564 RepID=A0A811QBU4_9POAL|nr:unnamed protein product [Miscanthus lutarioriparius]